MVVLVFFISLAALCYFVGWKVGDSNGYARGLEEGRDGQR
jgi:hypothetical protein